MSTPPAEALVVAKSAALSPGMSVLEPSAGTGNIAVLARLLGTNVDTNEIDPRRRELLTLLGFEPMAIDAERLDNLLPVEKTYDAIVMNPPFSATGGRVNGHRTAFGARHIEQALFCDSSRADAWSPSSAVVWPPIGRDFVTGGRPRQLLPRTGNVGIDGQEYARFGTTFGNQIPIVIDRNGEATDEAALDERGRYFVGTRSVSAT